MRSHGSSTYRAVYLTTTTLFLLVLASAREVSADACDPETPIVADFMLRSPHMVRPGEEFTTSLVVHSTQGVEGFTFFVDFNEDLLELLAVTKVYGAPSGEPFEVELVEINNDNDVPNNSGSSPLVWSADEGYVSGQTVFSSTDPGLNIPPLEETGLYDFHFRLRPETDRRWGEIQFTHRVIGGVLQRSDNTVLVCGKEVDAVCCSTGSSDNEDMLWLSGGMINILLPGDCDPENPPELDAEFTLGEAFAAPGATVSVPLSVRANERIHGFSFSIDFDETVLQVEDIDIVFRRADGAPWYYELTAFNNADVNPGSSGLDEGYVTGMVIFEFWNESGGIPVDTDTAVAEIRFAVRPDAAIGSTELRFLDGAPSEIGNIENEVVTCGHSVSAPEARSFVFINGVLQIIDEITIFIRGDTNGDAQVNISDPIATLGYLFLGGRRPPCPDAADANDDGTIGLTDAVATLNFLFWGVSPLPPPSAAPGIDLTEDVLGCGQPGE